MNENENYRYFSEIREILPTNPDKNRLLTKCGHVH